MESETSCRPPGRGAGPTPQQHPAHYVLDPVAPGRQHERIGACPHDTASDLVVALLGRLGESHPESPIGRVDPCLATRLGILHSDDPDVGKDEFPGIADNGGNDVMPGGQNPQRPIPRPTIRKVGDDNNQAPPAPRPGGERQPGGEIDPAGVAAAGNRPESPVHVSPTGSGGNTTGSFPKYHRPDSVAADGADKTEDGRHGQCGVSLLALPRSESHRTGGIDHQRGFEFVVGYGVANKRALGPRRHVPVDATHVVTGHIGASLSGGDTGTGEETPVIAVQEALNARSYRNLELTQPGSDFRGHLNNRGNGTQQLDEHVIDGDAVG